MELQTTTGIFNFHFLTLVQTSNQNLKIIALNKSRGDLGIEKLDRNAFWHYNV